MHPLFSSDGEPPVGRTTTRPDRDADPAGRRRSSREIRHYEATEKQRAADRWRHPRRPLSTSVRTSGLPRNALVSPALGKPAASILARLAPALGLLARSGWYRGRCRRNSVVAPGIFLMLRQLIANLIPRRL
jgi:hypothetical protein